MSGWTVTPLTEAEITQAAGRPTLVAGPVFWGPPLVIVPGVGPRPLADLQAAAAVEAFLYWGGR